MILTNKQEEGLKIAVQRYKNKELYTVISGYAGTGKSTLVKFIISALNLYSHEVAYIAYTGKAALVLKEKGCPNATTAHQLLYKSYKNEFNEFIREERRPLEGNYKLIIVDEVSMIPKHMWDLLLSHKIHIIALGDPGQLPPVKGVDNGVLSKPHIFLEEIMRQAKESEIIRLSMGVREGKFLPYHDGPEVKVIDKKEIVSGMYLWADQILTGKNETRQYINQVIREHLYKYKDINPKVGDKIICLNNYWNSPNEVGDVIINGSIGKITKINESMVSRVYPQLKNTKMINFMPDYSDIGFNNLLLDNQMLTTGKPIITEENFYRFKKLPEPRLFDYGYAITVHKAQGSEYDKVMVFEEQLKGTDHARWLYTAVTRAKKKLVIVKDYK
jgi:exodeoxyribonuclease-5